MPPGTRAFARLVLTVASISAMAAFTRLALSRFSRAGHVHRQVSSLKLLSIKSLPGASGVVTGRHLNEGKASRPAGIAIGDNFHLSDFAVIAEEGFDILFRGLKA